MRKMSFRIKRFIPCSLGITCEIIGPVSTPTKLALNSCEEGSTDPSGPTATPVALAKPGIAAKFAAKGYGRTGSQV